MAEYPFEDFVDFPETDDGIRFTIDPTGGDVNHLTAVGGALNDCVCPAHIDDMMTIVRALRAQRDNRRTAGSSTAAGISGYSYRPATEVPKVSPPLAAAFTTTAAAAAGVLRNPKRDYAAAFNKK